MSVMFPASQPVHLDYANGSNVSAEINQGNYQYTALADGVLFLSLQVLDDNDFYYEIFSFNGKVVMNNRSRYSSEYTFPVSKGDVLNIYDSTVGKTPSAFTIRNATYIPYK